MYLKLMRSEKNPLIEEVPETQETKTINPTQSEGSK
jgi:hypothetical protein